MSVVFCSVFTVPSDHPCLPGHFPGQPVVPGVVVLDHVLQALETQRGHVRGGLRMPQVKFVQPLLPGEQAQIVLEGAAPKWKFRVQREDTLLASGELLAQDVAA
jgi:3-hydroxymyristoyl/3-hydroxydecanoyl-(acyl carrier protein) dehydratase